MEKNFDKLDKAIIISYWSLIGLSIIFFISSYLMYGSLLEGIRSTYFITLLSFPLFILLTILYKRGHKDKINKNKKNRFIYRIKYIGFIIFFVAIISIFAFAIKIDSRGLTNYQEVYTNEIIPTVQLFRDLSHIIWPIILLMKSLRLTAKIS